MSDIIRETLEELQINGITAMNDLEKHDRLMYKFLKKFNGDYRDCKILHDERPLTSLDDIERFIKYHYGNKIVTLDLYEKHLMLYFRLSLSEKGVRKSLEDMGITPCYRKYITEEDTEILLAELADKDGIIHRIPYNLKRSIWRKARKKGMEMNDYIKERYGYIRKDGRIAEGKSRRGKNRAQIQEKSRD